MRRIISVTVLLSVFAVVSLGGLASASAQDDAAAKGASKDDGTTTYNFDDDIVTGDLVRPDGEILQVRGLGKRASLIQIREHFIPEMLKSVEDL